MERPVQKLDLYRYLLCWIKAQYGTNRLNREMSVMCFILLSNVCDHDAVAPNTDL